MTKQVRIRCPKCKGKGYDAGKCPVFMGQGTLKRHRRRNDAGYVQCHRVPEL